MYKSGGFGGGKDDCDERDGLRYEGTLGTDLK